MKTHPTTAMILVLSLGAPLGARAEPAVAGADASTHTDAAARQARRLDLATLKTHTLATGEEVSGAWAAGAGRFVVLWARSGPHVLVLDPAAPAILRKIPAPSSKAIIAAGLDDLLVISPETRTFVRYSLSDPTLSISGALTPPKPGTAVTGAWMGASARGSVILAWNGELWRLELDTLRQAPISASEHPARLHPSADESLFGLSNRDHDLVVGGVLRGRVLTRSEGNLQNTPEYVTQVFVGDALPSADGTWLHSCRGIADAHGRPRHRPKSPGRCSTPAPDWPVFVAYSAPIAPCRRRRISPSDALPFEDLAIHADGRFDAPLLELGALPELTETCWTDWGTEGLAGPERILFLPGAKALLTFPAGKPEVVVRQLDLVAELERRSAEYFFVTSTPVVHADRGQRYEYSASAASSHGPVRFSLTTGPEGMTVSPEGLVSWLVPEHHAHAITGVALELRDPSGAVRHQTFLVKVAISPSEGRIGEQPRRR